MRLGAARVANGMLAGLLTGNELGSKVAVHPALATLAPADHLRAEQAVTRSYGRVMPVLMSATVGSFLPVALLDRRRTAPPFLLNLAGLSCYAAMLGLTLTRNLPINEKLLELGPGPDGEREHLELRARWDRLHTARNVLDLSGLTLTLLSVLVADDR